MKGNLERSKKSNNEYGTNSDIKQTALGNNPTVLDAYFAQQNTKSTMKKTVLLILVLFLLSPLQKE